MKEVFDIRWEDVRNAYDRMNGLQLFKCKAMPGNIPGHILCIGALAQAWKRCGRCTKGMVDTKKVVEHYCAFRHINERALLFQIAAYGEACGLGACHAELILNWVAR